MFYDFAEKALALEKEGRKVVRLNVGDTNLPTPERAIEAATASLRHSKSGYCSSAGIMELRQKISQREGCDVKNVVVGPGSKHLIYGLMSILCRPGDQIAFPSPHWPAYELASKQLGLRPKMLRTPMDEEWRLPEGAVSSCRGAKLMIMCNPLNPTSTAYPEAQVREMMDWAEDGKATLILDEAYKGLSFREIPRFEGEAVVRVRSFSKEFSMEGWRLGYAVAPEEIAKRLVAYNQITATCVAPFVQEAGIACLEDERAILAQNRRIWRSRSDAAQKALSAAGFSFAKPDSGIYVFATHGGIGDSEAFALELLSKEYIAVAAGTAFGDYRKFVRICVNQPEYVLADAIGRMGGQLG